MVVYINDSGIFKSDNNLTANSASSVNRIEKLKNVEQDTTSVIHEAQKAYVAENTPAYNISISSQGRAAVQSLEKLGENMRSFMDTLKQTAVTTNLRGDLNEARTGAYTNTYLDNTDDTVTSIYANQQSNERDTTVTEEAEDVVAEPAGEVKAVESRPAEPAQIADEDYDATSAASSNVNTNNLTRYSEFQLRQMVLEGAITNADMSSELEKRASDTGLRIEPSQEAAMRQAVAAYDYQMAYQINAMMTQ
ncbi:MAG: hypothetical protein K6G81_05160 [Lachnospiraceae bacterium]|nr:hypothetical protein [Lachnospiraceae bacterium]